MKKEMFGFFCLIKKRFIKKEMYINHLININ